jgi:CubicO group peptidase (beta-lactamase class C family)
MDTVEREIDQLAGDTSFAGVVRVDQGNTVVFERAYGLAHRGLNVANTVHTQFGIASGTKGLTALTLMSLIEDGVLSLSTTARSLLGSDLALIADDITIEHLLAHRSGIGDYIDEDQGFGFADYLMTQPVHLLDNIEAYLPMLDGHPAKAKPNDTFSYNNSGYVILALLAERATGCAFADLVDQRVCQRAGMTSTSFLRSDELPGSAAVGYLYADGLRTNSLHLPVRGSGDGGVYCTVADVRALWTALFAGRIVLPSTVATMIRPRSYDTSEKLRYGLGFWLHESEAAVKLEGYDAGVSFRSWHDPERDMTQTEMSNWSDGAWPISRRLNEILTA